MLDPDLLAAAKAIESIGRNCELGMVQRVCGAEPISLLRWSGAPTVGLIAALQSDFEGLMETATGIGVPRPLPAEKQKWWLTCTRYQMVFHTTEQPSLTTVEQATDNVRRRLRWQAGKLMEDIREGTKTFLYSSAEFADLADAGPIIDAFRKAGGAGSLVIVAAGPPQSLVPAGEQLWFARLPKLTGMGNANTADIPAWLPLLGDIRKQVVRP